MKIGILGTGVVGRTIGARLAQLGHDVKLGGRAAAGDHARFADAAAFGELLFNCTNGAASLEALQAAGAKNLDGKPLLDVSNPLDFSKGMPPRLLFCNDDSLGERIQKAFPGAKVVKTLNTLNADLMVHPEKLRGDHEVFVGGNDAAAKQQAVALLKTFGWKNVIDLGDITSARATEMWLPLWLRLYGAFGNADFNLHIAR